MTSPSAFFASRPHRRTVAALAAALLLAACSSATEPHGPPGELTRLPRDLTGTEQQLIGASNTFSFALWSKVSAAQPGKDVFLSPLSASFALGMTLDGAANQSFEQMRAALQMSGMSQQDINAGYKSLMALLTSLDPGVTMRIANSIWYRQDFPFAQSFLDDARTYFDAEVRGLDFKDSDGSSRIINGWVDRQTSGKVTKVIDGIDPDLVMFLINALYFKGSWRARFDPAQTTNDVFTTAPGVTQPMRLMHRRGGMLYAETPAYQAVDLPYGNGAFTMTLLLPKPETDVETVSAGLTGDSWRSLVESLDSADVELALPRFTLSYERLLNDDLKALGMVAPFGDGADFTRMSSLGRQLYISFVKQNTFVKVDEEGTEAAAVTVVAVGVTSVGPRFHVMRIDRPFLFVIRERLSGTILFMGKVVAIPAG